MANIIVVSNDVYRYYNLMEKLDKEVQTNNSYDFDNNWETPDQSCFGIILVRQLLFTIVSAEVNICLYIHCRALYGVTRFYRFFFINKLNSRVCLLCC